MALYPPMLEGLVDENGKLKLYVSQMKDPGQASVDPYLGATPTDRIKLTLKTKAGIWTEEKLASPNSATSFAIPKSEFVKGLAAGPDASVEYNVSRNSGNSETSPPLVIQLVS
ncbi:MULTISPECIES: hypothetical protein [Pseudomonas]|uniref:hypothetical protein n=1 Tax=Pseudomonas TaxID=286 RepID=UPI0002701D88|nr:MULTISPECIES: hypothetical protein [Pseudomonas]EJM28629.1 hypothetical protein PMI24_02161 [Pseudomonas sp. GM25]MCU0089097.1 hypothetical protein [Pseudomonas koreensis]